MKKPLKQKAERDQVMGRPTNYRPEMVERVSQMCKAGATLVQLADALEVSIATIHRWMISVPEFRSAIKDARAMADQCVEESLYHRAMGYEHDAVKIFMHEGCPVVVPYREKVPPDTAACIFWLKNRQKEKWRDVNHVEHSGGLDMESGDVEALRAEVERRRVMSGRN